MIPTFLDQLGGFFDRRFIIAFWVPVFTCVLILAGTWIGLHGFSDMVRRWDAAGVTWTTVMLFAALFCISLVAFLLQAAQTSLVRLYAGYWPLGFFKRWGEQREGVRQAKATSKEINDWFYLYSLKRVQATRLGNVITAAYDYPDQMYGANAAIWWSRLTAVLPEAFRTQVDSALTPLFALLNLCTALILATLAGSVLLAVLNQFWLLMFAYLVVGAVLARACYNAAVNQAVVYGEQVRTGFDLYRGELLKQMRIKLPEAARKEKRLWQELEWWVFGYRVPWQPRGDKRTASQSANGAEGRDDFYYDNRVDAPHAPDAKEIVIALDGVNLLTISTRPAPGQPATSPQDKPAEVAAEAAAKPAAEVAAEAATEAQNTAASQPGAAGSENTTQSETPKTSEAAPPRPPFRERVKKFVEGLVQQAAPITNFIHRQSMVWIVLVLLLAIGGVEVLWASNKGLQPVIAIKRDLPALSVIGPADLMKDAVRNAPPGAVARTDEAVGRVTVSSLQEGMILTSALMSTSSPAAASALEGRRVLSLPADHGMGVNPGEEVIVFGVKAATEGKDEKPATDNKEEVSQLTDKAISLGEQDGRLWLAFDGDSAKKAAAYMIDSRRLIVLRKLSVGSPSPTPTPTPTLSPVPSGSVVN